MKVKYIFLLVVLIYSMDGNCQKVDDEKLINTIKNDVAIFFVSEGKIDKNEAQNLNSLIIQEIYENKTIGFNANGIYVLSLLNNYKVKSFLIKEGKDYKIYSINSMDFLLRDITLFSIKHKLKTELMIYYITTVIKFYENNNVRDAVIKRN